MRIAPATLVLSACLLAPVTSGAESLRDGVAADYKSSLGSIFTQLHSRPELSGREVETSKFLAKTLRGFGYQVTESVGGTGVVAVMKNGSGPTVLMRADMDGLPVEEKSGLPYASKVRQADLAGKDMPVMHACGHDVHVTSLIGAAKQLAQRKGEWSGTLVLIGQSAEETLAGARSMLKDGLYERFPKPDYALAFHVSSRHPAGKVQVPIGIAYSSSDSVDIIVHGVGAHGASPHLGVDPVLVASQIVVTLQSVVSRSIDPLAPGVITVGSIHGGTKRNIIGDRVDLQLTVRADSFQVRDQLLQSIDRVAAGVATSLGVPQGKMPEVIRSSTETTPPTINDEATARRIRAAFVEKLGAAQVIDQSREGMGAEDFAQLIAPELNVKGVYFTVGGTPPEELAQAPSHHSPLFKIQPEPAIKAGTEAMVVGALTLLAR
jgi:hippurate hydrolase